MHLSDHEALLRNTVWQEIVRTLKEIRVMIMDDILALDPFEAPGKMAEKQGRVNMIDFVLGQPDAIKVEIELELNKAKGERGE